MGKGGGGLIIGWEGGLITIWSIGFLGERATVSLLGDKRTESVVMQETGESNSGSPASLEL
jgi:hypothetical protein